MIHPTADTYIELLERQRELVAELAGVSERQGTLIESGGADALLGLLSARQQIMDRFAANQDRLADLNESLRGSAARFGDAQRQRIAGLVESIGARLGEILERDERDRACLEARRDGMGRTLANLGAARQAHDAYTRRRSVWNRFADRRG
jgi:hypothetical protein